MELYEDGEREIEKENLSDNTKCLAFRGSSWPLEDVQERTSGNKLFAITAAQTAQPAAAASVPPSSARPRDLTLPRLRRRLSQSIAILRSFGEDRDACAIGGGVVSGTGTKMSSRRCAFPRVLLCPAGGLSRPFAPSPSRSASSAWLYDGE